VDPALHRSDNAWVHQTVEAMSLALMVDAKGDKEILAAQHPDGDLQTAFTVADMAPPGPPRAINHYSMSDRKDARLYDAAKKLADCWVGRVFRRAAHRRT
jgi:uncharacterized protein